MTGLQSSLEEPMPEGAAPQHQSTPASSSRTTATPTSIPSFASPVSSLAALKMGVSTPDDVLRLQALCGNQAVQRMLKPRATPSPAQPPPIQRTKASDLTLPHGINFPGLDNALETLTQWEDRWSDPVRFNRRKAAITAINAYVSAEKEHLAKSPELLAQHIINTILPDLKLRKQQITLESFTADNLIDFVFKDGSVSDSRLDKLDEMLENDELVSADDQATLFIRIIDDTGMECVDYFDKFKGVHAKAEPMAKVFLHAARQLAFIQLSAEDQLKVEGLLDYSNQRDAALKLVQTEWPALHAMVHPMGLMLPNDKDDRNRTLDEKAFSNVLNHAGWTQVLNAVKALANERVLEATIRQLSTFVMKVKPSEMEVKRVQTTILSIVDSKTPGAKTHLLDALANLIEIARGGKETGEDAIRTMEGLEKAHKKIRLLRLMMLDLYPSCLSDTDCATYLHNQNFKSGGTERKVYGALIALKTLISDRATTAAILKKFFEDLGKESASVITTNFVYLEIYVKDQTRELNFPNSLKTFNFKTLKEVVTTGFRQSLDLTQEEFTDDKLETLKTRLRDLNAVIAYARRLRTLKSNNEQAGRKGLALLKQFILATLKEDDGLLYRQLRYGTEDKKLQQEWLHLQKTLGIESEAMKEWQKGDSDTFVDKTRGNSWVVLDTDAPSDMLLIGTEQDTCQSAYRDDGENVCLLSYMVDGKNRAIVIKRNDGGHPDNQPIIARSIFRILYNPGTDKVVLFLENMYVKRGAIDENEAREQVIKMAQARATAISQYINVELAGGSIGFRGVGPDKDASAPKIKSLGGPWDYEYSDTGLGRQQGPYALNSGDVIELPYPSFRKD